MLQNNSVILFILVNQYLYLGFITLRFNLEFGVYWTETIPLRLGPD